MEKVFKIDGVFKKQMNDAQAWKWQKTWTRRRTRRRNQTCRSIHDCQKDTHNGFMATKRDITRQRERIVDVRIREKSKRIGLDDQIMAFVLSMKKRDQIKHALLTSRDRFVIIVVRW